jgi:hypothetical protein
LEEKTLNGRLTSIIHFGKLRKTIVEHTDVASLIGFGWMFLLDKASSVSVLYMLALSALSLIHSEPEQAPGCNTGSLVAGSPHSFAAGVSVNV